MNTGDSLKMQKLDGFNDPVSVFLCDERKIEGERNVIILFYFEGANCHGPSLMRGNAIE